MAIHSLRQDAPDPRFGVRLREERKRLRLTQAGFATAVGISTPTQTGYELGARTPDINYLTRIEQLGVDGRYVRTGIHEDAHAVKVLDWDRYAAIRDVVSDWIREMELEMTTRQVVEVESLVYELCVDDPGDVEQVAGRVLRLVSSRRA